MIFLKEISSTSIASESQKSECFCYLGLFLDGATRGLSYCGNTEITLTPSEYGVLKYMLRRPTHVHSRESLQNAIISNQSYNRQIDSLMKRLRKKLSNHGVPGKLVIVTLYGAGYRLWRQGDLFNQELVHAKERV